MHYGMKLILTFNILIFFQNTTKYDHVDDGLGNVEIGSDKGGDVDDGT